MRLYIYYNEMMMILMSPLKEQSTGLGRHVAPLAHIILLPSQPVFDDIPNSRRALNHYTSDRCILHLFFRNMLCYLNYIVGGFSKRTIIPLKNVLNQTAVRYLNLHIIIIQP